MGKAAIIAIIFLVILIIVLIVLYFVGKKMQKRQDENNAMLQANKQYVSMLIIDKKRMKIREAGLPQAVLDQTPKALRGSKMPIVKAKIGPQIMTLICEESIFDDVPVKKEVKATVSGIYITSVKGIHGPIEQNTNKKQKSRFKQFVEKMQEKAGAKPVK